MVTDTERDKGYNKISLNVLQAKNSVKAVSAGGRKEVSEAPCQ